jgi:hypothetical protein
MNAPAQATPHESSALDKVLGGAAVGMVFFGLPALSVMTEVWLENRFNWGNPPAVLEQRELPTNSVPLPNLDSTFR